jgi:hypothetical protein
MPPRPQTDRPGDRRYAPGRSVPRERFEERPDAAPRADARAKLNWQDRGVSRPVKNLGWLQRNSAHVSNIVYERGAGDHDAVLKARGQHPTRGSFEYEVPFASREVMRGWVGKARSRWDHVSVEDRLRDGGA